MEPSPATSHRTSVPPFEGAPNHSAAPPSTPVLDTCRSLRSSSRDSARLIRPAWSSMLPRTPTPPTTISPAPVSVRDVSEASSAASTVLAPEKSHISTRTGTHSPPERSPVRTAQSAGASAGAPIRSTEARRFSEASMFVTKSAARCVLKAAGSALLRSNWRMYGAFQGVKKDRGSTRGGSSVWL